MTYIEDEEENRNEGGYHERSMSIDEWQEIPDHLKPVHEDTIIIEKERLTAYVNKNRKIIH